MTDHYSTLDVPRTASQDEIKRAYRKLASQHHPDRGGNTQRFQEIQAAYDVLGDEVKRQAYDNPRPQFGGFGGFQQGTPFDFDQIFQMFGQRSPHGQRAPRPARMNLWISLADVAVPGSRTISVGTETGTHMVDITIPSGIEDGDSVQYPKLAPNGNDLVVTFRIKPDTAWTRSGSTVTTQITVDLWTLILGGAAMVQDLAGKKLEMSIPARTQPGTVLRVRGHGVTDRQNTRGDMMVKIQVRIPATISNELLAAIKQEQVN
jgi:DnaJ-class molecular chaperone